LPGMLSEKRTINVFGEEDGENDSGPSRHGKEGRADIAILQVRENWGVPLEPTESQTPNVEPYTNPEEGGWVAGNLN